MSEQAAGAAPSPGPPRVPLSTIAREWGRIGCIGFGGPPAHIALLRKLCVEDRQWLPPEDFEDGLAACNLLPGPASTQLAIFCAWRIRGAAGALLGGVCFIVPGLVIILGLAALFLAPRPVGWIAGAAAGAGAAVPAVAVAAAAGLTQASWRRAGASRAARRPVDRLHLGGRRRWPRRPIRAALAGASLLAACGLAAATAGRGWCRPRGLRAGRGRGADPAAPRRPGPSRPSRLPACCRWPPRCQPRPACSRWPGRASRWAPCPTAAAS